LFAGSAGEDATGERLVDGHGYSQLTASADEVSVAQVVDHRQAGLHDVDGPLLMAEFDLGQFIVGHSHGPDQARVAQERLEAASALGRYKQPIVTQIEPAGTFYPAEGYHQDFIKNNPTQGYIVRWDLPKVAALKNMFPTLYSPAFKTG